MFLFRDKGHVVTREFIGIVVDPYGKFVSKVGFTRVAVVLFNKGFLAAIDFPPFAEVLFHDFDAVFDNVRRFQGKSPIAELFEFFLLDLFCWFKADPSKIIGTFFFPPFVEGFDNSFFVTALLDLRHDSGSAVKNTDTYNRQNHQVMDWLNFF